MPTAVERFLNLDFWNNYWEQRGFDQAFLKIDNVVNGLETNGATNSAFLKLEHSPSVQNAFDTVGDAFLKLGGEFGAIANVALKIDDFVIKLTSSAAGTVTATSVDVGNPQTDFLKLDTALATSAGDLKILGGDFLKLDQSSNLSEFELKLSNLHVDFKTLSTDVLNDGSAFNALGADFVRLGAGDTQADQIYKGFGGDLQKVGSDFNALSADFLKLDQALSGGGGGAGKPLAALNQDLRALGADLHAAAGPASSLIAGLVRSFGDGGGSGRIG